MANWQICETLPASRRSTVRGFPHCSVCERAKALQFEAQPEDTEAKEIVRTALRPSVNAAVAIRGSCKSAGKEFDLNGLIAELSEQCAAASQGPKMPGGDVNRASANIRRDLCQLGIAFRNEPRRISERGGYLYAARIGGSSFTDGSARVYIPVVCMLECPNQVWQHRHHSRQPGSQGR
jgi:hypothetical protein